MPNRAAFSGPFGELSGLALLLVSAGVQYAEDWPHWRGPSASGVSGETGLPVEWSDTENITWKAEFRGVGISSPIVAGGRVFVTSQIGGGRYQQGPRLTQSGNPLDAGERPIERAEGDGTSFVVTALDQTSGEQAWEYVLAAVGRIPPVHEKHNLASPSPVTDGERVFALFGTGQIVALGVDGSLVWNKNLALEYGAFDIVWGHGSSPIVYDGNVILQVYHPSGAYLLAVDAESGDLVWKVDGPRGATSYSTPLVIETDRVDELIVNSSVGLAGHDAASGELLWTFDERNQFPVPSAIQNDSIIYTSRGHRSGPYMAIQPGGRGDISESHVLWRVGAGAPYLSSLVYYEGLLYMMGDVGVATVVDAETGERLWQDRIGGVYTASPVAADGKVYYLSEDGEAIVLQAGRNPQVLARNQLNARQLASPAISNGRLFIRSDNTLFAIGD